MDPAKQKLIQIAASQTEGKKQRDLAPILFSLITNANRQGIKFSKDEFTFIMQALKEGKTKKEQDQIDKTVTMVRSLLKL